MPNLSAKLLRNTPHLFAPCHFRRRAGDQFINRIDTDPKAPPLDLVLLDMRLPKCDGEEVLKRLRSTKRYARTPAIIMTGLSSSCIEEEAIQGSTRLRTLKSRLRWRSSCS